MRRSVSVSSVPCREPDAHRHRLLKSLAGDPIERNITLAGPAMNRTKRLFFAGLDLAARTRGIPPAVGVDSDSIGLYGEIEGELKWETEDRFGTCPIDVTLEARLDLSDRLPPSVQGGARDPCVATRWMSIGIWSGRSTARATLSARTARTARAHRPAGAPDHTSRAASARARRSPCPTCAGGGSRNGIGARPLRTRATLAGSGASAPSPGLRRPVTSPAGSRRCRPHSRSLPSPGPGLRSRTDRSRTHAPWSPRS